jgi:hypothetical protein
MALMGSESTARLLSPYYPVLAALPFGLIGATRMLERRFWRIIFLLFSGSAVVFPITTPSRPLLPIPQLANYFSLPEKLTKRIDLVYKTYSKRSDALAELREFLPKHAKKIGLICSVDDTEVSFWKPFNGERRVYHIKTIDKMNDMDCVIVNMDSDEAKLKEQVQIIMQLKNSKNWKSSNLIPITLKIQGGQQYWIVYCRSL